MNYCGESVAMPPRWSTAFGNAVPRSLGKRSWKQCVGIGRERNDDCRAGCVRHLEVGVGEGRRAGVFPSPEAARRTARRRNRDPSANALAVRGWQCARSEKAQDGNGLTERLAGLRI